MSNPSPGKLFKQAVAEESPLQVIGTINAYSAMLAHRVGFRAIYLSGGGVANASYGLPDLGMTTLNDVLEDVKRITAACPLPLLVDIDTGWGNAFMINRTIKQMIKAGAAAVHIEDQIAAKRCGHRPNKAIVSTQEMVDRVKAAVDAKTDEDFVIMARTDALAVEGLDAAIERACLCKEAGADMIFPEAMTDLAMYKQFANAVGIPILANITEFGQTPLYTVAQLREVNVGLVLYPLSAFRAQARATLNVYETLRREGTQESVVDIMQPRMELYDCLGYHEYEQKLDELYEEEKSK
ncbi:MAG TPA: methylisocitrate lyase [Gammaproteobacteria bacterium]|nr:methylisocitrate lyase [Gammaproteobacteria bacterium]